MSYEKNRYISEYISPRIEAIVFIILQIFFATHAVFKKIGEYLTIIPRNRAEYRLILSRRGRRPNRLKNSDYEPIVGVLRHMENSAPSLKFWAFRTLCKIVEIKIGGKTRFENLLKTLLFSPLLDKK